jgi:hypothetical protein
MTKGVAVHTKTPGSDPESGEMSVHARGYHWAPQSLDVIAAPWLCTMRVIYLLGRRKRGCVPDCSSQVFARRNVQGG